MHSAAYEFVFRHGGSPASVIEIGSRDINGSVRALFPDAVSYVGLDLYEGPAVDWVGDAREYEPVDVVECVVCCEVLEHAAEWRQIVAAGANWLATGGRLIITCAGPGRPEHSAIDGRRLKPGEHYANVTAAELDEKLRSLGLEVLLCREHGLDTQALAQVR